MTFETQPKTEPGNQNSHEIGSASPAAENASQADPPPTEAGAGQKRSLGGPGLRPAALLALQRTVGNRDVQRLLAGRLQRQQPPAAQGGTGAINEGMFDVQNADIRPPGQVTARKNGDKVTIESPAVEVNPTVSLKTGVNVGGENDGRVDVGPVQTVMGGNFTGVYRKGGDPKGEITYEEREAVGQVRDAQWNNKPGGGREAAFPAPWYSQPTSISDSNRSSSFHFFDKPGKDLKQQIGDGRLTEAKGQDRFIFAVGAKRGGTQLNLKPQHWEVPWDLTIDNQGAGTGSPVSAGVSKDGPPTLDGPIAVEAARAWGSFTSVEAAMATSAAVLLENLVPAKANDPTAHGYICEALRRKNPTFTVKIKVEKKASFLGDDEVVVSVLGHKQAGHHLKLGTGAEGTAEFTLNQVLDVAAIDASTRLHIAAQDFGEMWAIFSKSEPLVLTVAPPFAAASTTGPAGGGSRYTISLSF